MDKRDKKIYNIASKSASKLADSLYGLDLRLRKIEKYPLRVIAVLVGLFTVFNAMTLQVTSPYNSFGILWCSLIVLGFSGGLIIWGICSDCEW